MQHVNTGAYYIDENDEKVRVPSKRMLTTLVRHNPERLSFDPTSQYDGQGVWTTDDIGKGVSLDVVGPDPFTSRKWYASVSRDAKGKIAVR